MSFLDNVKIKNLEKANEYLRKELADVKDELNITKQIMEQNNPDVLHQKIAEVEEEKNKFILLNKELENCKKKYEEYLAELRSVKSKMTKDLNKVLTQTIKENKK